MRRSFSQVFTGILSAGAIAGTLLNTTPTHAAPTKAAAFSEADVINKSWDMLFGAEEDAKKAVADLVARGKKDIIPTMIMGLRFRPANQVDFNAAFEKLTGEKALTWNEAMLWQEANPQIKPHKSFRALKLFALSRIDPNFLKFLGGDRTDPEKMKIRLEEITWGGVSVDGIPSLDNPTLIPASQASYLVDSDEVFGVEINGDVRAYPLRIMGWHEMFNDVIGGVPVALAYCTLCGNGALYETGNVQGFNEPLVFGSSGFLYRSNKLMFDRTTLSLWNQFTGKPVNGPLVDSGVTLKTRPVVITSWGDWKKKHPNTKVLSLETGHFRDYGSGVVYKDYFASDELMFPALVKDETLIKRKDYIFGMQEAGGAKAFPVKFFKGGAVINDAVGLKNVVLVGDASTRTVRAYFRDEDQEFRKSPAGKDKVEGPGGTWQVSEEFLIGPNGKKLPRAAGSVSYWFAWENYHSGTADLYNPNEKKTSDKEG